MRGKKYDKANNHRIGVDGQPIAIDFLGLWDTVDAYGLPVDELTHTIDLFITRLTMRDLNLSAIVKCARHALSLDDQRHSFHPRLWNEPPEPVRSGSGPSSAHSGAPSTAAERIGQVWFAGVHANVGGGYPDDSLAHASLLWMMKEASQENPDLAKEPLRFRKDIEDKYRALEDENGPINNSRRGLAGYYRYNPRRVEKLRGVEPSPAASGPGASAALQVTLPNIHESVLRRIKIGHDGYAPISIPEKFAVVRIDGGIVDADDAIVTLRGNIEHECEAGGPLLDRNYTTAREQAWDWVWWRRFAYFVTLVSTLFMIAMPLSWPAEENGACSSSFCFLSEPIQVVGALLPAFASTWIGSFASYPSIFLVAALVVAAGIWMGRFLERRVADTMRAAWYGSAALKPSSVVGGHAPSGVSWINRAVRALRTAPWYEPLFVFFRRGLLPGAFLVSLIYAAVATISYWSFSARSAFGHVCVGSTQVPIDTVARFDTKELCLATGLSLDEGSTYRVRVVVPPDGAWKDLPEVSWWSPVPASPKGIHPDAMPLRMALLVPLRRHLTQPWFKLMARIGKEGTDIYPLQPEPAIAWPAGGGPGVFETRIVARSSGKLFLYVNDAIFPFPRFRTLFYDNNQGFGKVTVEKILPEPEVDREGQYDEGAAAKLKRFPS